MQSQNPNNLSLKLETFANIFDSFNELVFIKDTEFRLLYVNPAFLFHMEYSPETLLGKTAIDLWPEFAPHYQQHDCDIMKGDIYHQVDNC